MKRCYYCKRPGHFKRDCVDFKRQIKGSKGKNKTGAFKVTITAEDEDSTDIESTGLVVQHALSADGRICDRWILDSGATCHMYNKKSLFSHLVPLQSSITITLGDGHSLQAIGHGNVTLKMKLPLERVETCTLHDVLFVPDLAYNLLSITAASKRRKVTTFTEEVCEIRDLESKLIASGHREGSLYYLDQQDDIHQVCTSQESKRVIWHRRLGHLGSSGMEELVKRQMIRGLDFDCKQVSEFCEPCTRGKSHRLPFKRKSERRTRHPLELVHTDVCGKIGTKSLSGGEYFVSFIDDYTCHSWIFVLKRKSDVYSCFQKWKAQVEKSTGKRIKALLSDNGGEYTSKEFTRYLAEERIRHELTTPHTPEQNGVAERLNRTLMEGVRTMLVDSKLPRRFWAEALSTMVYIRNRSPTKALAGITPHEAWSGYKPRVDHLRIFGCRAYAHIPGVERRKLDPKSHKCVLLGYGTEQKGYRLYNLQRQKVIHTRDVVFDKHSMPGDYIQASEDVGLEIEEETGIVEETGIEVETGIEEEIGIEVETGMEEGPGMWEVDEERSSRNLNLSGQGSDQPHPDNSLTRNGPSGPPSVDKTEPSLRRSTRIRLEPDRYSHNLMLGASKLQDPISVTEATSSPDSDKWMKAMQREMESLRENNVWRLVEPPPNRKVIGSKWVFKRKTDANGEVERYKARLVAQGFSQKLGLDYEETFSPIVRFELVRTVIALGAQLKLQLHQMDVSTAFLNGNLSEEVYLKQPEGFIKEEKEEMV